MMKLVAVALASTLALAVPAVGFAKDYVPMDIGAEIHIVSTSSVGGSVDGVRAAAVAGEQVVPVSWVGQDNAGLRAALDARDLATADVDAVFAGADGVYWVFVTHNDRNENFAGGDGHGFAQN